MRLWLGDSNADSSRGSLASVGCTRLGWFGQAYGWAGLPGLAVMVVFLLMLVWFAYDSRARNWGPEVRARLWVDHALIMHSENITIWMPSNPRVRVKTCRSRDYCRFRPEMR